MRNAEKPSSTIHIWYLNPLSVPQRLVTLLLPQNFKGQQSCCLLGQAICLWSVLIERHSTLPPYLPVVLAFIVFWRHTRPSLFHVQALPSPQPCAFKTGLTSPNLGTLLSHGVRLPHHPFCPSVNLQILLFSWVLKTKPMPQPEGWPGFHRYFSILTTANFWTSPLGSQLVPKEEGRTCFPRTSGSWALDMWSRVPWLHITMWNCDLESVDTRKACTEAILVRVDAVASSIT